MLQINLTSWFKNKIFPGSVDLEKSDITTSIQHAPADENGADYALSDQYDYDTAGGDSYVSVIENDLGVPGPDDDIIRNDDSVHEPENDITQPEQKENDLEEQEEIITVGLAACEHLHDIRHSLDQLCSDMSPLFVQIGRDLQTVSNETKTLTATIRNTAGYINSNQDDNTIVSRTRLLIQGVSQGLANDQNEIEQDLQQVLELITHLSQFRIISNSIDSISSSFRVVRINIQIQSGTQAIDEDIFKGVLTDINTLSHKLNLITAQIKKDLLAAERNMTLLNNTVKNNLKEMGRVSGNARDIVSNAFENIEKLMDGATSMMEEASVRSEKISGNVDEVVVSIQFQDSMNQRVEHIMRAFDDIRHLLSEKGREITPGYLGTAFFILDLQHKQLVHLISEISFIHESIKKSFLILGDDVEGLNSILHLLQLKGAGNQDHLDNLFSTLEQAFLQLCGLFSQGKEMIEQMNNSVLETKTVSNRLLHLMEDVKSIHDDARLQAVNTIIMASALQQKGKTIEVLAKEIKALSDKTNFVSDDVTAIQNNMSQLIDRLCLATEEEETDTQQVENSEKEFEQIRQSYREIEGGLTDVSQRIDRTCTLIQQVHFSISFLENLESELRSITAQVEHARESLAPWQDEASQDSKEIDALVERYSMKQERLIHLFDGVDETNAGQHEDDVFF